MHLTNWGSLLQHTQCRQSKISPRRTSTSIPSHSHPNPFLCKCTQHDVQTAVSFLTTRVKHPNEDDWEILKWVLQYLHGTCHMKLNLSANNLTTIQWWVKASHATHNDCRGHMGAMTSLGKDTTISFSNKLKVNTKSSTESELAGADQALSSILHTRYFTKAQGYSIEQNLLFQDNQSTMHLEDNGSFSSSKQTKHIECRYFFIWDKLENGNLEVIYCPTKIMWADVLAKPKQGGPFCLDRSILMNISINNDGNVERKLTHLLLFPKDKQK